MSTLEVKVSPDAPVSVVSISNRLAFTSKKIEHGVTLLGTDDNQKGIDLIISGYKYLMEMASYISVIEHSNPGTAN